MSKKLSRRDFARTSVAAGAAAAAFPGTLAATGIGPLSPETVRGAARGVGAPQATRLAGYGDPAIQTEPVRVRGPAPVRKVSAAARGTAAAKRLRITLPPPDVSYGGDPVAEARDSIRWIVENQMGYLSSAYKTGRYALSEGATRFLTQYMRDVALPPFGASA